MTPSKKLLKNFGLDAGENESNQSTTMSTTANCIFYPVTVKLFKLTKQWTVIMGGGQ